jgi:DNA polymerase-3 subunit alpha
MTKHEPSPIVDIGKAQRELSLFKINLLNPDIIKSDIDFSIEGNDIRFGLLSIKGISNKSIEKVNKFRNKYSNKFQIFEGAKEAGLSVGILCALIQAGAISGFDQSRSFMVLEAQLWNLLLTKEKKVVIDIAVEFNYNLVEIIKHLTQRLNEKGKPVIKESRMETIRKHYAPFVKIYDQNKKSQKFANWYYEYALLGYAYSHSLKEIFMEKEHSLINIKDVTELPVKCEVAFAGVVKETYSGKSKAKGTKYFRVSVQDNTGQIEALLFDNKFNNNIEECKLLNGNKLPVEDNIVIVKGKTKEGGGIFADIIAVQDNKIFMGLRDIEDTPAEASEVTPEVVQTKENKVDF